MNTIYSLAKSNKLNFKNGRKSFNSYRKARKIKIPPNFNKFSTNWRKPRKKIKSNSNKSKKTNSSLHQTEDPIKKLFNKKQLQNEKKVDLQRPPNLKRKKSLILENTLSTLTVICLWSIGKNHLKIQSYFMTKDLGKRFQKENKNSYWIF